MDDFEPFLQIIHISDLHVVDPRSPNAASVRSRIRKWRRVSAGFANWMEEGTSPHDALAVPLFEDFLREFVKDPSWAGCETWLVDTGDLTSLGDAESFDLGRDYLRSLVRICPKFASIYGNHDAWPGEPPLLAKRKAIEEQWKVLVNQRYLVASPRCALKVNIPHGRGQVQLYFVDSVIRDRWRNAWALGEVSDTQLKDLQGLVDQNYDPKRSDLRILAVHHPIHYPPPRPGMGMVMRNDKQVAAMLDTKSPAGAYPLVHLVLSGHTHSLYPVQGALPAEPYLCIHTPLQNNQVQLVVGTLMQLDRYGTRDGWPHQSQILRFYYSTSDSAILSVERLLAARQSGLRYRGAGIGPYKIVPVSRSTDETAEEISFAL
jgi:3',5'-cyclic AMP phosphodiesterase CpdA